MGFPTTPYILSLIVCHNKVTDKLTFINEYARINTVFNGFQSKFLILKLLRNYLRLRDE